MLKTMRYLSIPATLLALANGQAYAETAKYEVEPTHTFVTAEVKHFKTSTLRIRFDDVKGTIQADAAQNKGSANIEIQSASVNSGTKDFDDHLKSPDFLNAATYPTITFVGNAFEYKDNKLDTVKGDLTLLGKTHPLTLKASNYNCYFQPVLKENICGGDFSGTIQRTNWGMNFGIDMGIPDDVKIVVQIEAIVK